jgi:hypothetical protein
MPEGEDALWDWMISLDEASRMALLAHCVSHCVKALHEQAERYGARVQPPPNAGWIDAHVIWNAQNAPS